MKATRLLHDDVIEAIVRGDDVDPAHHQLATFAERVRALGDGPAPAVSAQLAALLDGSAAPGLGALDDDVVEMAFPGGRAGRKHMFFGPMAKLGLGAALAVAGVGTAGAVGMLPAAANDAVRGAIEVVSPVDFAPNARPDNDSDDNFGSRVSADATGESDGEPGVDGQQISDEAPGAAHRPDGVPADEPPGQSGETGLTRANQTPAASHAPDAPTSTGSDHGAPADPGDPDGDGQPGVTPPADPHGPPDTALETGRTGG
jgi:hypothetical protein